MPPPSLPYASVAVPAAFVAFAAFATLLFDFLIHNSRIAAPDAADCVAGDAAGDAAVAAVAPASPAPLTPNGLLGAGQLLIRVMNDGRSDARGNP